MIRYALTIFLSAFLLFQVQPLIAKFILPWFGGTPAVWTTCMLFFQMMLLVGYAYAHLTSSWLTPRTQAIVHSVLLAVSLYFLPIIPNEQWKPTDGDLPAVRIAGGDGRNSVSVAIDHRPVIAKVVQPHTPRHVSLPVVFTLERGVAVGVDQLSLRV